MAWSGLAFALALVSWPAGGRPGVVLDGRVVGVVDGDTLTVLVGERPVRVRLAQIDAPERGQPYGRRARAALSELVFGKDVRLELVDVDEYGRAVAEVYVGEVHVNAEMVRQGHAWAYTRYARSAAILALEDEARAAGRGLWQLPESQRDAPWEWRHRKKRAPAQASNPAPAGGTAAEAAPAGFRCGTKRTCREMRSCAEARFHLLKCGLTRLDGDGDGVPCESLCRP